MSRFEDDLRQALQRVEPSEGFAERVMAKTEAHRAAPRRWSGLSSLFQGPRLRWAAAFACLALVGVIQYERVSQERAEGERAKQQVMLALRITAGKLRVAQDRVQSLGRMAAD